MQSHTYTVTIAGKTIEAEFTDLTARANGSVLMRMGETVVLVTAVMGNQETDLPYFPLSVEFEEKFYAAGAILGSRFMRREGRPSEEAILSARIVDRTIRPLFDHSLGRDVQIVVTVLAMGEDDPDILGVIGTSLALSVSDIPWAGPVGAVRIGRHKESGAISINPTYREREEGLLDFEVLACGKDGLINMIETAAHEVSEDDMITILEAASQLHTQLTTWQAQIVAERGVEKFVPTTTSVPDAVSTLYAEQFAARLQAAFQTKQTGKAHLTALEAEFATAVATVAPEITPTKARRYFEDRINDVLHEQAVIHHTRADGRALTDVRPLVARAGGISPVLHGSGIFYRGETRIFSALTLAGPDAALTVDTIEEQSSKKRFMHHYNFPPFSVGETGRVGGFNRRMIGHGALAEKALAPVIPPQEAFPYTIRLVSETLTSNGSSSMGSVCASTLALMDGGVPIVRPVAGIAIGLALHGEQHAILTDIQGPEDEFGDMDCKVAGTEAGITAIQLDVKVRGVSIEILREALAAAKTARTHILTTITNEIAAPRAHISDRAPKIVVLTIKPEQIGTVIGSGGKTINGIKEETGVEEISIEEDGRVYICGTGGSTDAAAAHISALTREYQVGDRLDVTVTKVVNFGAFARLDPHHEGLIHISEVAPFRIEKLDDLLSVGQVVPVEVSKVEDGKIGLSIKRVNPTFAGATPATE